jgi:cell wall-associated NlpC family hydrolase
MLTRLLPFVMAFVLFTGCSVLRIHPEAMKESDISVSWEESDEERMVVSYTAPEERDRPQRQTPAVDSSEKQGITDTISITHAALFEAIDEWIGTPYGYGKHQKQKGTDCSGFTMEIYRSVFGIKLNRSSVDQVANTTEVKKEDLEIGDLVFFNIRGNRISHVGIYIGNNKFVHASTKKGVIISDLDESYYKTRYVRSGRVNKEQ